MKKNAFFLKHFCTFGLVVSFCGSNFVVGTAQVLGSCGDPNKKNKVV